MRGRPCTTAWWSVRPLPKPSPLADPKQRVDRRSAPGPPQQYWRVGPYLVESVVDEEVRPGVILPFVHHPLGRYVNALVDAGLVLSRMLEPAPPAGFLARAHEYEEAATIPRLLVLLCERSSDR